MPPEDAVRALAELAAQAGVEVRVEPFALKIAGKGGLCRIDGRPVILVDEVLGALERAGVIGQALGTLFARERPPVMIPLALRHYLRSGHGKVGPLLKPRPLARVRAMPGGGR